MHWYVDVLKNYAGFSGRARRQEFWMFYLINLVVAIVVAIIDSVIGLNSILSVIYTLAVLIPALAVTVRRLHDTGKSGWWILISLIPLVGSIILLVFLASAGQPNANAHGENPKQAGAHL
ncbi:DUF805 domain-containing protein [Streptomyces sp. AK02-01A]|uniref:DUF805 domain-containing protein n=1 Tax=Streptomyces sp. AK02-01A TaxID=3028648 RepID=UPI0029AFA056|nr:DUF805 domain-containing protein [Streptomyces sp. AK02-01A]MDX3854858.1 DUF805 domain-containing protein [Streptomyces sp. AK02-01A]